MKIGIYTLTAQRDKFIDEMLAEKLREYGHDVDIRSFVNAGRESVCYEKPDMVILPMIGGQYKIDFVKKCKEWGIEVIVRRGEAGLAKEQFDKIDDNRKTIHLGNWDYGPYVDLELVWGKEFADILHEYGHIKRNKIKVCGAFAFDPYFEHMTRKFDPYHKPTVLFATGFSTADCRENYAETGLPEGSDYHSEITKIHRKARDTWLDAIEYLVDKYGDDWSFELKVRPGETAKVYKDKVPSCVKIHPEKATSSEVLKTVDMVVHSGSTLAIEAHLMDIPSFNFCNVNPDMLLSKVSPAAQTVQELEYLLWNQRGRTNIVQPIFAELQDHLYGKIDGMACKRAASYIQDHIDDMQARTVSIPNSWPAEVLYPTEDTHIEQQEGDSRWTCPCCRNVFWGEREGFVDCPFCGMKIDRTVVTARSPLAEAVSK